MSIKRDSPPLRRKQYILCYVALNYFDVYLNPTVMPMLVYTDHNPIVFINKMKDKNQCLLHWSLSLLQYNVEIHHIRGKENVIADALSNPNVLLCIM